LQGEGAHAGRASVFCRLSVCNLWNGEKANRYVALTGGEPLLQVDAPLIDGEPFHALSGKRFMRVG
jgi:organic radical activating enzyme